MEDGKTVTEPTAPTRNGYDFCGWYNEEAEYKFDALVKSDLTLTAKWTVKTYKITYVLNGGTNSDDNPATYTIEKEDITLKDPTAPADKPNFGGWFREAEFKTQVTKIAKGSTGDLTLYAYFSEKPVVKHSVKVMCGETEAYSGEVLDGAALSEDDVRKAAKAKIPEGCELEGFYSDAAFTTKFDFSKAITDDTVIYAKITEKTFTVSFEGLEAKQTVGYGKTATEPEGKPTKDGYTFKGWFNGDAEYNFDTPVTGEITLKANWEPKATEPTVLTSMTAVKNEDGTFSLPDGTYQTTLDSSNPILIVTMPESVSMKAGDSVKLTGTVTFDDKTVYKQFYLQTHDKAATPIFGWNMVAEWSDTGLKGLKKDLSVTQKIASDYSFDTCKFVLAGPLTEGDTTCPTFTLKDVKIKYVEYVAPVGGVIKYTDDITIAKNYNYNTKEFTNFQVVIPAIPNEKLSAGKTVSVTFKATVSRALTAIQGNFVDNTKEANWWKVLNSPSDVKVFESETASTDINSTCQFTINTDATAESAAKFVIYVNGTEDEDEIKLTNVDIGIKIE